MGNSSFYIIAKDALSKECKRLCDFTDLLDNSPTEKNKLLSTNVQNTVMPRFHGSQHDLPQ